LLSFLLSICFLLTAYRMGAFFMLVTLPYI
jgi:hypothetical protein